MMRITLTTILSLAFFTSLAGAKGLRKAQEVEPKCGGDPGCWYTFSWETEVAFEGDLVLRTSSGEDICHGWGGCSNLVCGAPCSDNFVMHNNHTATPSHLTVFGFLIMTHDDQVHAQFRGLCPVNQTFFTPVVEANEDVSMELYNQTLKC